MDRVTVDDARVIGRQLDRRPRGLRGVALRCSHGYPQVAGVSPFVDGAPFPTLYWLTCPLLRTAIDLLEADGWIGRLEERLASDSALAATMTSAHRRYVEARWALLEPEERRLLAEQGMNEALSKRGIGGLADRTRLKCLHLHVAHELADKNPIGEIVLGMLHISECLSQQQICSTL